RVERAFRLRPLRIDFERLMQAVGKAPEQLEAIPAQIGGDVGERPFLAVADALVIVRVRHHPMRRALEDHQPRDVAGDAWPDLVARRAGADHRDALAAPVEIAVPLGGVKRWSFEGGEARDVWELWPLQHAAR